LFDFVFSVACFEHFRDPATALSELWRVLRPGGRTAHQIDLRDHRHFDDPLRFLQFDDRTWAFMHPSSPSMYQNRWRLSQYVRAFQHRGFATTVQVNKRATPAQLEALRFAAKRFRPLDPDDRVTLGCLVVAEKPRHVQ
jgi:SAM-dependent methyltransferase